VYQSKSSKNVVIFSTEQDEACIPSQIEIKRKYAAGKDTLLKPNIKKKEFKILKMQAFFNILNISPINSWVIQKSGLNLSLPRRKFILQLIEEILMIDKTNTVTGQAISGRQNQHLNKTPQ
jgi:hypothetical protein